MAGFPMLPGNAAEDAKDGGRDDAKETPVNKKKKKPAGGLPPGLQAAIARKLGAAK